jgi:hypothetical protein
MDGDERSPDWMNQKRMIEEEGDPSYEMCEPDEGQRRMNHCHIVGAIHILLVVLAGDLFWQSSTTRVKYVPTHSKR